MTDEFPIGTLPQEDNGFTELGLIRIKCPNCSGFSQGIDWKICRPQCDDCGSHSGLECPKCQKQYDHVFGYEELEENNTRTRAIICDIDGTLAHRVDRSPYDYSKVLEDGIDPSIHSLLKGFQGHYSWANEPEIILVSGRDEACRKDTLIWLRANKVEFSNLFMRPETEKKGNKEPDVVIKERIYREHIESKYDVLFVLDDRDQCVKLWRDLGLKCLQVAYGNF